jgi:hypothetical protein
MLTGFFSTWRGLFTVNLFLLTLSSTLTFTVAFWDAWEKMWRKRPELWRNHNWLLHHDNVPAHTSLKTTEFVTNNNTVIISHPLYLPDLDPCDFTLFPKLKIKPKEWRFESVWHPKGIASGTRQHQGKWLPRYFWSVEKTMGLLYTFPRRLSRMWWQLKLSKLSQHFFSDPVRELSNTSACISI